MTIQVSRFWKKLVAAVAAAGSLTNVCAYEGDVHYGLTKWLAQGAGFDPSEVEAIALGNYRVDSGAMNHLEVIFDYACANKDRNVAQKVWRKHFPSGTRLPSPPAERRVDAGGEEATRSIAALVTEARSKEGQFLALFGETLHTLQDSWSHAGVPEIPNPGRGLLCDANLASGHPKTRGGPHSHSADLTYLFPADVMPMAKATYQALVDFPSIQGRQRKAKPWDDLAKQVEGFALGRTKTEKRKWFVAQGMGTTDFLEGVSLPDGPEPGSLRFAGRWLTPLKDAKSSQWDAPDDARLFFDRLITRWLSKEDMDVVVSDLARFPGRKAGGEGARPDRRLRDLTARMKLWKLRDHGSVAMLAHSQQMLDSRRLAAVDRLTKNASAFVQPARLADAFFPLVARGDRPSPLLPYVVRELPPDGVSKRARMIAISRLKHAPNDTVGWIAERSASGWVLVNMVAVVDH